MKRRPALVIPVFLAAVLFSVSRGLARDLSFDDRVKAQEAIERVYYAHQIGAARRFEVAVPRALIEAKVRNYLRESSALERFWRTSLTSMMLRAEMERMARETRMPERLRELYAALGDDPFLIEECLARPALADRLTRNFFAYDRTMHAAARREAERLRGALESGKVDPWSERPEREVLDLETDQEIDAWAGRVPSRVGEIGPLVEERDAFVARVLLDRKPAAMKVAIFTVKKRTWDDWWIEWSTALVDSSPAAVASTTDPLPKVYSTSCAEADAWDNGSLSNVIYPRQRHTAVWTGSLMIVWGSNRGEGGGRYDPATDTWTQTSIPPFKVSDGGTAVWTGSFMVLWGGSANNTGARYDPLADSWVPTSTVNAPAGRSGHMAVWTGSRMIVWGGRTQSGEPTNTGGQYDPVSDSWTPTSMTGAPVNEGFHSVAVWTGSRMIVWGPYSGQSGRYDPLTDTWAPVSAIGSPTNLSATTGVWTGTYMVVLGRSIITDSMTGGRYNPVSDTWLGVTSAGVPSRRESYSAVWTGHHVIVWGGADGTGAYLATGGRYDPQANSWTPTSNVNAPPGRYNHTAVWADGLMIVWGGSGFNVVFDSGGRYDPVADSWTPTSDPYVPAARTRHTAVWTGSLMVVWGGGGAGGRYDPATDTWTPTALANAPPSPPLETAVWSGEEMIVWGGGTTASSAQNTGGRYNPTTDSWKSTSTSNAPAARYRHTAVWTGSEMLVWGGTNGTSYLGTGGRYDPTTDTWQAISLVNSPSPRGLHTAVRTGSAMIVWGGYDGAVTVNTGGRYDPVTDTWSPTATAGAPSGRSIHSAVWTGTRMVVWGGVESTTDANTGGRYDPATDTWTPTAMAGAPAPRSSHTAVWTGKQMIVWGGHGPTNTGGLYDPLADTWTPTTTAAAPTPRYEHTAVLAGERMIVWGGTSGQYSLGTGGRYCGCDPTTFFADTDGDGHGDALVATSACLQPTGYVTDAGDCNDGDAGVWGVPGEVLNLVFGDPDTLGWSPPSDPGGTSPLYDLIRSTIPTDFVASASCVATDVTMASAIDTADPATGTVFYYLVRAQGGCQDGEGPLGTDSNGVPRNGRACP